MIAVTGPEKTIWKWTKKFWTDNGKTEAEAEKLADAKVESMRSMSRRKDILKR